MNDYEHWLEAVLAALIGLGGWLWRLGRKEQAQEDRITRLEQWRESFSGKMRGDLNRIETKQHEQDVVLARIEANQGAQNVTLSEIRQDLRDIKGARREGGNRRYDPPRSEL